MKRRSFIAVSASLAAMISAPAGLRAATLLPGDRIAGARLAARPDPSRLVGGPGGCASHRGGSQLAGRRRPSGGFTRADFV